jgi:NAD(P)-dependent dehydrogenase (short-subunit alcohol dehydrogenase family)
MSESVAGNVRPFSGKVAVVTGASRGIGAATALRLAAEGAALGLVARGRSPREGLGGTLEEMADKARAFGVPVVAVPADLSDPAARATIIPTVREALGTVDILVNNAASAISGSALDMSAKRRRILMELNYFAPVELIQAVVPGMQTRGAGWIVNLTSSAALQRTVPSFGKAPEAPHMGSYGASKAALDRITNAIAMELQGTGIRVNAVRPRKAVLTEASSLLDASLLQGDTLEPMETMVEAVVALCECAEDETGRVLASLDLLAESGRPVRALDGSVRSAMSQ